MVHSVPLVYNVQVMKGYKVAEARAQFGALLDEAESGETVYIERHGIRFALWAEDSSAMRPKKGSTITWAHPAVEAGQWTWEDGPNGLEFVDTRPAVDPRKSRKRR